MFAALVTTALLSASPDFVLESEREGFRIETRKVDGSDFAELRISTTSPASVDALCDAAFGDGKVPAGDTLISSRAVLKEETNMRVVYDRVSPPVVSKRDYAIRIRRSRDGSGNCTVSYDLANELAPPLQAGWVRVPRLRVVWRFTTRGKVSTVEYLTHSEPGGDVPAFISENSRKDTELGVVRRLVARVR